MVRLRLEKVLATEKRLQGFNPTMVRLRRMEARIIGGREEVSIPLWCDCDAAAESCRCRAFLFQSHYGAIATRTATDEKVCPIWFQSHYGAIATTKRGYNPFRLDPFQSHYGAIATCGIPVCCSCGISTFQSHYGAIATIEPNPYQPRHELFQSHYGAIATASPF